VQQVLNEANAQRAADQGAAAAILFRQALTFARDVDQIEACARQLRELGQPVDIAGVFGFLREWRVIGPFDNTGRAGFATPFPPERETDWQAEYEGKSGKVRWRPASTTNEFGMLDLNQVLGEQKEVTAYAYAEFIAERAQAAELRLGCKNGWKVWWNGEFIFGRDEYHLGAEIDQYRLPVQLRAGRNVLLLKICQNEQQEEWTREWEFQLRICDPLGTPIRPAPAVPSPPTTTALNR
jgi:hypothetical protein